MEEECIRLPFGLRSAQLLKYGNKTDRPPAAVYAISCDAYLSGGFNERSTKQRDGSEDNPFILDAYVRVSLREQAEEGYSIEAQERAFREWQEEEARHGRHWEIRFHIEPGASGHTEVLEKLPVF